MRKASPDEDDLLTLLWEQEFVFLRYRYVDLVDSSQAPPIAEGERIRSGRGGRRRRRCEEGCPGRDGSPAS